jgi:hypothetical protein
MEVVSSLPPLQLTVAAWWEGWKSPPTPFHRDSTKPRINPHPSHQVSILAASWEGWKVSTTPPLFTSSSLTLLFYLLLLYYMFAESLLYTVPAICDLSNPYDLLSLQHYPIPTVPMGGWVKVPGHYSSIPRAPPWQHPTGSWPTQDSTILSQRHRGISFLITIELTSQHLGSRNKPRYFKTRCASLTLANSSGDPSVASSLLI